VNTEFEKICKEIFVTISKALSWNLVGGTEEYHGKPQTRSPVSGTRFEEEIPPHNTKPERYSLGRDVRYQDDRETRVCRERLWSAALIRWVALCLSSQTNTTELDHVSVLSAVLRRMSRSVLFHRSHATVTYHNVGKRSAPITEKLLHLFEHSL
jgi:hypothetical protein